MNELTFFITKASESDGVRRWDATVSEFAVDPQKDEVTPEFYAHSAENIAKGTHPTPSLVVSHLDDVSSVNVLEPTPEVFAAGWATEIYVDGRVPKARGIFVDNPLGDALWAAVKADIDNEVPDEERVRVSMAWHPEKGGVEKADGVRRHTRGVIKHFAATRVPIVKSTEIMVKSDEIKKTKYEDAVTIVGEDLAKQLAEAYDERGQEKSDAGEELLEKSEPETTEDDTENATYITDVQGQEHVVFVDPSLVSDTDPAPDGEAEKADVDEEETVKKAKPTLMSACIEKSMQAGKTREEAVSLCLQNAKKEGVQVELPMKSDADGEIVMKPVFVRVGEDRVESARGGGGGGFGPFPRKEKLGDCIERLMREQQMPYNAAKTTCEGRQTKRMGLFSRANFGEFVAKPDMYGTMDECMESYMSDEGMSEEAARDHCEERVDQKADIVEKPPMDAPMGACIKAYMDEGKPHKQAVAICMDKKRQAARKKAGHEEIEVDEVLKMLLEDDETEFVASEPVAVKSEADGDHPAEHYLVVVDPKRPQSWYLPVYKMDGSVDESLMDAAWDALHSGTYKGPMGKEAILTLMDLYRETGFINPVSKMLLQHAELEDILLLELLKAEAVIDTLTEELSEMTDKAHGDDAPATEETAEEETTEQVEETVEAEDAVKAEVEETEVEASEEEETPEKAETEDPETEEIDPEVAKAKAGESEEGDEAEDAPTTDVNESDVAEEAVKSETVSEGDFAVLDEIVTEIKAALSDGSLDRKGQVLIVNTLLERMGVQVDAAIKQTPPSADDTAAAFKEGMVEVVDPLVERIQTLERENADLKALVEASDWGGVIKPRPQQLQYKGVEKSSAEVNKSGLSASEVAEKTVGPVY